MKNLAFNVPAVLLASTLVLAAAPAEETPDWWKAKNEVAQTLMDPDSDLAKLVSEARASETRRGQDAMFRLYLFMRAGMEQDAARALDQLKAVRPNLENHHVEQIYYTACDDFQEWDLARKVMEVFADNLSEVSFQNRLLKHMEASGWGYDRIDAWLKDKPAGHDGFWIKERLAFQAKHGREAALLSELAAGVKQHPEDISQATAFLDALLHAPQRASASYELAWMTETVRPTLATDAEHLASRLKRLGHPGAADRFYRLALGTPLTEEEIGELSRMYQAFVQPDQVRARFAVQIREHLAACLLDMGRKDEAQTWMVKAQDLRTKHDLGMNAMLAGQVQAASGARTIQHRIEEEASVSKDEPEYWAKRAAYFMGRKETVKEEEALKRWLAMTEPQPGPEYIAKGYRDQRSWALSSYALFLKRMDRHPEAVRLLRGELAKEPATAASSAAAARLLAFDFERHLDPEDEVLWNWLAARPRWEHTEERLLWRLLESADRENLEPHFLRAEALVKGTDPSRAYTLGWIMNRMGYPARSVTWLKSAIASAPDGEAKERAAFTLFETYLDLRDWQAAERLFPQARKRLTAREMCDWQGRIAVAAAEAGSKADALRIWSNVMAVAPMETGALEVLVQCGLRPQLTDLYREMAEDLPESSAPAKALEVIGKEE